METATTDTKQAVADALIRFGVTYTTSGGERTIKRDPTLGGPGQGWECFAWHATLKFNNARANGSHTFHYYCGLGHVTKPKSSFIKPRPIAPSATDVLHSLLLDATALDENFSDWCGNYDYSNDSLQAMHTYQQCCDIGKQMRLIFTEEQRAELATLLRDY